jgi:hypothetical protein
MRNCRFGIVVEIRCIEILLNHTVKILISYFFSARLIMDRVYSIYVNIFYDLW